MTDASVVQLMHTHGIALLLLLAGNSAVIASDRNFSSFGHDKQASGWHAIRAEMSPAEYRMAYQHNQHQLVDAVTDYSKAVFAAAGVPGQAVSLAGTIMLLPLRNTRLQLNKNETMAVEFHNVMDRERALFLRFRLRW